MRSVLRTRQRDLLEEGQDEEPFPALSGLLTVPVPGKVSQHDGAARIGILGARLAPLGENIIVQRGHPFVERLVLPWRQVHVQKITNGLPSVSFSSAFRCSRARSAFKLSRWAAAAPAKQAGPGAAL